MPLPLVLAAGIALRYGAVALATWAVARRVARKVEAGARDQKAEDALDRAPEGMTVRREPDQANATARFRRVFRRRAGGPGIEIDLGALGRVRLRRVA